MPTPNTWPELYLPGVMLKSGEFLRTNEYLHSYTGGFYAIMQSDGNFVVYKGTCPDDNRGFLWHTARTGDGGQFFAVMQEDGNFCIYHGTPESPGGLLWDIRRTAEGKQFLAVLRDNGVFVVFKGEAGGFGVPAVVIWDSQTSGTPGLNLIVDQQTGDAAEASVGSGDRTFWQSFTAGRAGNLARVDIAAVYAKVGQRYESTLQIREGEGTAGRVLGTSKFFVEYYGEDSRIQLPWHAIHSNTAVPLTKGSRYTLQFTVITPATPPPMYYETRNAYAGGSCSLGDNLVFKTYCTPPWMPWPYPPVE